MITSKCNSRKEICIKEHKWLPLHSCLSTFMTPVPPESPLLPSSMKNILEFRLLSILLPHLL